MAGPESYSKERRQRRLMLPLLQRPLDAALSYVPVVPVPEYVRAILIPRLIETDLADSRAQLLEMIPATGGWPTYERLADMVELGEGIAAIEATLPGDGATTDVVLQLQRFDACLRAQRSSLASATIGDCIAVLTELRSAQRELDGHKPLRIEGILKDLAGRLTKSLPGDALFIGMLSSMHSEGYIAYLRLIREITHGSIATSAVHERRMSEPPSARRIGRLDMVYQHRLAQQITRVFSDIGLPEPYEHHWSDVINQQTAAWAESINSGAGETHRQRGEP